MADQKLQINLDVSSSLKALQALDDKFDSTIKAGNDFQRDFNEIALKVHQTAIQKFDKVTVNIKFNVVGVQKLSGLATIAQNFQRVSNALNSFVSMKRGTKVVSTTKTIQDTFKKISQGYKQLVKADKNLKSIQPAQLGNLKVLQSNVQAYSQVLDSLIPKVERMISSTNKLKGVRGNLSQFFGSFKQFFQPDVVVSKQKTNQYINPVSFTAGLPYGGESTKSKTYNVTKQFTSRELIKSSQMQHFNLITQTLNSFNAAITSLHQKAFDLQQSVSSVHGDLQQVFDDLDELSKKVTVQATKQHFKDAVESIQQTLSHIEDIVDNYQKLAKQIVKIPQTIAKLTEAVDGVQPNRQKKFKQVAMPTFMDPNHTQLVQIIQPQNNPYINFFKKYAKFCKQLSKYTQGTRTWQVTTDFRKTAQAVAQFYKEFSTTFKSTINNADTKYSGFDALQRLSQAFAQLQGGAKSFSMIGSGMANLGKGMQALDSVTNFKFDAKFATQIRDFVEAVVPVKSVLQTYLVKGSGDQGSIEPYVVQQNLVSVVNLFVGITDGVVKISQAMQGLRDTAKHIPTKQQISSFVQKIQTIGHLGRLVNVSQEIGLGNTEVKAYHADSDFRGFIEVAKHFSIFARGISEIVSVVYKITDSVDAAQQKTQQAKQGSGNLVSKAELLKQKQHAIVQVITEVSRSVTSSVGSLVQMKNFAEPGQAPDFRVLSKKMQGFFLIANHISKLASGFAKLDQIAKNLSIQDLKSPDSSVNRIANAINTLSTIISGTGNIANLQKTSQQNPDTGVITTRFNVIDANLQGFILIANNISKFASGLSRLQKISGDLLTTYGGGQNSYKSVADAITLTSTIVYKIGQQMRRKKLVPIDDRAFKIVDSTQHFKIFQSVASKMSQLASSLPKLQRTSENLLKQYGQDSSKFINSVAAALLLVDSIIQKVSDMFSENHQDPQLGKILDVQDRVKVFGVISKNLSVFSNSLKGLQASSDALVKNYGDNSDAYINSVAPGIILVDDITTQIFKTFTQSRTGDDGKKYIDFQSRVDVFKEISTILLNFKNGLTGLKKLSQQIDKQINANGGFIDIIDTVSSALKLAENIIDAVGVRGIKSEGSRKVADDHVNGFKMIANSMLNLKSGLLGLKKLSSELDIQQIEQIADKIKIFTEKLTSVFGLLGSKKFSKIKSTGGRFKIIEQFENAQFGSFANIADKVNKFSNGLKGLVDTLKTLGKDSDGSVEKIANTLKSFVSTMSDVAKTQDFKYFERLADAVYKLRTHSNGLITSSQKVKTAVHRMGGAAQKSLFSFSKLHPVIRQFFTAFAGYNVIYSFVRSIQAAAKANMELQYAMARINTIVKTKSSALMQKWTADVMKLSSEYGIAKNDITKALYEINSATIIGADAMKVLKASVAAARAGFTDTTRVAQLLSKVINAYGYSASDAGYLSDVLFRTVERGINTMEQLSQYMGRVVTVAANSGVSFEEVSAALATMTARGLQTNIAVTALNSAILKMSQGGQKLDPIFRKAGYASASAALQTVGLKDALKVLYEQTRGDIQALTKLGFNYRDIRAVSVLASDAFQAFGDNLKYVTESAGATDTAVRQVKNTLQYKWQSLKQTVSNAFIAFQNSAGITSALKSIVDILKQIVIWTTKLFTATSNNLTAVQSFVRWMLKAGVSIYILKNIAKGWTFVKTAIASTHAGMVAHRLHLRGIKYGWVASKVAVRTYTHSVKAAMALTGKGLIFLAVIQGISWAWNKVTGQTQKATDALQNYSKQFEEIGKSYQGALQSAINFVNAPLEDFKQALSQVNTAVGDLKTKLEALEAERKGLIDAGQDVPEQLEKEIAYYKKQIEVLDELMQKQAKRRRDLLSDKSYKQRLNVTSALKNISEQYQKTLQKQTSALQDYTKALIELAIIRKQLGRNGIGINIDLIGTNRAVFEEQVLKATPNLDSSDMSALIKLRQVFQKFGKTTKQATSQIQKLSKAFSNLQIPNNQFKVFYQLQRKVKEVESKRRNIAAVGSQTISKEVQDDLNKYAGKITVAQWNAQQQKNIRKLQYNLNVARFKHARHNAQLSLDLANQGDVQLLDHLNSLGAVSSQGFVSSQFASKLQKLTDTDTFRKLLTWTSIPGNKAGAFLVTPESLKAVKQQIKSRIEKRKNLMQDPIRKSIPEQYLPQYAELEDKSPEGAARFLEAKSLRKMLKANIEKVYDEFNRNMITAVKSGDASNVKSVFQVYGISDTAQQAQILKTTSITSGQIYDSLQPVIQGKQKLEDWVKRMTDFGKKVGISEDALKDYTKALWDIANDALHLQQAYQNTMDNLSKIRYASDEQYVKALQDLIVNTKKQEPSISQVSQNYKDIAKSNPLIAPAEAMNKAVNSVTQFANLNAEQKKAIAASAGLVLQAQQSIKKIQQRDKKEGEMKVPEAIRAQTAMSLGSSEFVNMFLSQTTETPQQKSLKSIDSTSKRILKSVNKSANINASLVII